MADNLEKAPIWMVRELRLRTSLPLLECQRLLSAASVAEYRSIIPEFRVSDHEFDALEANPEYATVLLRAALETDAKLAGEDRDTMGFCHLYWNTKQQILRDNYGVIWHSPAELNPHVVFD